MVKLNKWNLLSKCILKFCFVRTDERVTEGLILPHVSSANRDNSNLRDRLPVCLSHCGLISTKTDPR